MRMRKTSTDFFPPKKKREEEKENKVAEPVLNYFLLMIQ